MGRLKLSIIGTLIIAICLELFFGFGTKQLSAEASIRNLFSNNSKTQRNEIQKIIKEKGGATGYKFLIENAQGYNQMHNVLHIFGEELYKTEGEEAIKICDSSFAFGCYHGFSTQAIISSGVSILSSLESVCNSTPIPFACNHGLGHGLLEYYGHDNIVKALDGCAGLSWKGKLYGCQGGVFMEYNLPNVSRENSVRGQTVRELTEDNTYSICDELPDNYQRECYYNLSQWWIAAGVKDFKIHGEYCSQVEDFYNKNSCYLGIGNEVSPVTEIDLNKPIEKCNLMSSIDGRATCLTAVNTNYIDRDNTVNACESLGDTAEKDCLAGTVITKLLYD